jgi:hypothetical protein
VEQSSLAHPSGIDEFFSSDLDVSGNLPQENRRNIPPLMEWHGRASAVGVAKLLVRTSLSHLLKTKGHKS